LRKITCTIFCLLSVTGLTGTVSGPAAQDALQPVRRQLASSHIANPASENCVQKGGRLVIRKRTTGGEYGICLFGNDLQCEEWAMFRGDCPVGGIGIAGYVTPAAQFCAITGGSYAVTGSQGSENEQGTCTFRNGEKCDAWSYFDGECVPNK
jgi:putative hemolysin